MAAVTTERLMSIALELAGWDAVPPDCAVYYPGTRISHVLYGLDIGVAELFMARQLGYHAVIAYAPAGHTGPFWEVYHRHVDQMTAAGVPPAEAEAAVSGRIAEMRLAALAANDDHIPSVARLLEMPFLNIHSPLDELSRGLIQRTVDAALAAQPQAAVATLRDALLALPAFAAAHGEMLLPLGAWDAPAGHVVVSHGAFASGGYPVIHACLTHGVDTVLCADVPPEDVRRLTAEHVRGNLLVLGRAATANLGIAPYITRLRADGLEVTPFAGVLDPAS